MEKDMLKLWLLGQGIGGEAADAILEKIDGAVEATADLVTSVTHAAKAHEAMAVLAAAEASKRLGKDALAAAFLEHAEHLVFGGEDDAEEGEKSAGNPA